MSQFDLLVLVIIGVSALIGWYRGGVREAVTLGAIAAGFLAISLFGGMATSAVDGTIGKLLVLAGLFLAGDTAVSIAGSILVRKYLGRDKKRGDRIAGAAFGILRGWVLAAFVLFSVLVYHEGAPRPQMVERSLFAPALEATAEAFLRKADVSVTELSKRSFRSISLSAEPTGT
ncbi:CvpA family protein [Parvularcula lutaonensis]|uniref:CvpA family protein n=1 Tax=Parvularcula lutaonensis TaxID=491923 RepID=A0ABV7M8S7_9PROT|nr:CvpA family protein [Parvularcula lutaonensis]GGY45056.1 hypothetical protein GCM10007148_12530 [Parvularcula lutaonensis]